MCGIIGTTDRKANIQLGLVAMSHRGPDAVGDIKTHSISFGHNRLSIIDLSELGNQPFVSADGTVTMTYNGEIYNYKELKADLENSKVKFRTNTDTEVIVEGYRKEGINFFNKLRGMWALALYDANTGKLLLSRDQFGIKPLYYAVQSSNIYFASEMKALINLGINRQPNTEAMTLFFNLGYFMTPDTCYKGVYTLQPGQVINFDMETKSIATSFLRETAIEKESEVLDETDAIVRLHRVLLGSVEAHLIADVPVGVLFSGGNDSALIAAIARDLGHNPKMYHLSIDGSIDTEYALAIADKLGLDIENIQMTNDELVSQYEQVWNLMSVPFADMSIIPTSLIYKKIHGKSKVVLSGEGADEWFGGYRRHVKMIRNNQLLSHNIALSAFDSLYGSSRLSLSVINPIISRLRSLYLQEISDDVIGAYMTLTKTIDYPIDQRRLRNRLLKEVSKCGDAHSTLAPDRCVYLLNDLLHKGDTASMAYSIEARVPFVDKEVYKYVQSLPVDFCLSKNFKNKHILKKVLEKYLPKELVYRDKKGFSFSFEKYKVPLFREDTIAALSFHRENLSEFGLEKQQKLLKENNVDLIMRKYPQFALALVSNMKVFR